MRGTYIRRRVAALVVLLVLTSAGIAGASAGTEGRSAPYREPAPTGTNLQVTEGVQRGIPTTCSATAQQMSCTGILR